MAVVSESSPLIALHQIRELDLLRQLFGEVVVPDGVAREAARSIAGAAWIRKQSVIRRLSPEVMRPSLGAGEYEAISLAVEISAGLVILDDGPARRTAFAFRLPVMGTAGVLLLAKERGLVHAVKPRLDILLRAGFFLSDELYQVVLRKAAE